MRKLSDVTAKVDAILLLQPYFHYVNCYELNNNKYQSLTKS